METYLYISLGKSCKGVTKFKITHFCIRRLINFLVVTEQRKDLDAGF